MRTKIAWFLTGCVVASMIWSTVTYVRHRPRDYTQTWAGLFSKEELDEAGFGWLRNARKYEAGTYRLFMPANSSNGSAQLQGTTAGGLPGVSIQDGNGDGNLDSVLIVDSAHRHFTFVDSDGNGEFDSYSYTTGMEADSKTFRDDDMDGQFDFRLGPGRAKAAFIDAQWRDVLVEDNRHHVELRGELVPIEIFPTLRVVADD